MNIRSELIAQAVTVDVSNALAEDVGGGDITAQLIPAEQTNHARVITREAAVICGRLWVDEVFRQIDPTLKIHWHVKEGEVASADTALLDIEGSSRAMLTAERTALNFLQTLSGTATQARHYVDMVKHTDCKILDTRKTIPGLRIAQKYATHCGGAQNHRLGLWDAYLIKENHIMACGGIAKAVELARANHPGKPVEVEVETLAQLEEALEAAADIVMLDNFSFEDMRKAVKVTAGAIKLEASGNITEATLVTTAETGVDYISIGAITKHCRAIDLSMRILD